jgi:translation initiation factor 5
MQESRFVNIKTEKSKEEIDPFYRYKMPRIVLKHEGRGNGVRTIIVNLKEIAESLSRRETELLQYLAVELSVCSTVKNKVHYTLNGTFSSQMLQDIMQRYVKSHVSCGTCENPETEYKHDKKAIDAVSLQCKACGKRTPLFPHKINKAIARSLHSQ